MVRAGVKQQEVLTLSESLSDRALRRQTLEPRGSKVEKDSCWNSRVGEGGGQFLWVSAVLCTG